MAVLELELDRQVAVDLKPDAYLNERRRCPSHGCLPCWRPWCGRRFAWRTYTHAPRIQEIRSIAFIYSCVPRWSGLIADLPDPRSGCRQGMSPPKTAPYGSWLSPIPSDFIVAQSV